MLASSLARFERELPEDALVLDVGGWAKPLHRADWVLDVMPYATRGLLGSEGDGPERFTEATWVMRDICDHEPWPFDDGQFDFAVCSNVLEDIRDPLWVCSELQRVARAGYIEVPSRLEEQSWYVQGEWVGWAHHHWLIDVDGDRLDFLFKPHHIHAREEFRFPTSFWETLSPEQRWAQLWWKDRVEAREVLLFGPGELDAELAGFVARNLPAGFRSNGRGRGRAGRALRRLTQVRQRLSRG
jgi:hypothetical protein